MARLAEALEQQHLSIHKMAKAGQVRLVEVLLLLQQRTYFSIRRPVLARLEPYQEVKTLMLKVLQNEPSG